MISGGRAPRQGYSTLQTLPVQTIVFAEEFVVPGGPHLMSIS